MKAEEIKKLRIWLGWTQREMAAVIGVKEGTLRRWELGQNRPSPLALEKLAKLAESAAEKIP